ncbi:MAG: hypothetical protein IIC13_14925 [SAR324 cluster bacterium]|nr:hypothetical protein [SAR324 cluster bacterium]MCH8887875.1 hypothetical protein [SAR324 cluster bacterium]
MPVKLRPLSDNDPLQIESGEYDLLIARREGGWSHCSSETEWLAKLHYLRQGLKTGKLERAAFEERERRLVEGWLKRLV